MGTEKITEIILELLKREYILKEEKLYFKIKENEKKIRIFFKEKFGYDLLLNNQMTKVERVLDKPKKNGGIESFVKLEQYIIYLLILNYLEEIEAGRTILISDILSFIVENYPKEIDWKNYYINLSLIKVLKYCREKNIIKLLDGSEQKYATDKNNEIEILYENTGLSKNMMFELPIITDELNELEDYIGLNKSEDDTVLKKARRALINNTVINENEEIFYYIKENRELLEEEFNIYFNSKLIVLQEFAYLLMSENEKSFTVNTFPDAKNITTITLLLAEKIKEKYVNEKNCEIKKDELMGLLEKILKENEKMISKENQRKTKKILLKEILELLENREMIEKITEKTVKFSKILLHFNILRKEGEENE
ncbi:MAG: hypothetical protein B6I28_01155 [Fusobacteriia bacterium 4572_132]|nr:MAG: hypothetical protein B6I28_01155 [Fusobacteriia bacterium 4572_132]